MKTVLIIAGSDPGAGAGLQQDLKAVTLSGVYGLTVTTAHTIQNSRGVQAVHPLAAEVVAAQLEAVLGDFPVTAVKIGMLATGAIVSVVAAALKKLDRVPIVLDPVLAAGGGFPLLDEAGIEAMLAELFPRANLLTPNVPETARLTGMAINTPAELEGAARRLQSLGPDWVLAKGGHLPGEPVDILCDGQNSYNLAGVRLDAPNHHGTGCLLASAAAAGLARGLSMPEAVNQARLLTQQGLKYGLALGAGTGPVNSYASFARELARFEVLEALQAAAARLQAENLTPLIPEAMTNLGYAVPYPEGPQDVAAFPGRLVKSPQGVIIPAPSAFGASRHIAAVILTAMAAHPETRSAMNIRHVEGLEELASLLRLRLASFDRNQAPGKGKIKEGANLAWNVASVLRPGQSPPDLIYDKGDWGKEPMIRILGPNPMAVAEKALALKNALQAGGRLEE